MVCHVDRRSFITHAAVIGTAVTVQSAEEAQFLSMLQNPQEKPAKSSSSGAMPTGTIGNLKISRIIAGGNIISGWCHQRDLLYVSTLAGQYLTQEKQFDTLEMMEEAGINACSPDPTQLEFINQYKDERGGRIQTVTGVRQDWEHFANPTWSGLKEWIDRSVDDGSTTMYTQGGYTEHVMKSGKPEYIEIIGKGIEYIKQQGMPAGLGCHDIKVIEIADEYGIDPDYYFKTFHHDQYWSAHPVAVREHWSVDSTRYKDHNKFHDNIFDLFPHQTQELMAKKNKPWIAFKTLAAGAIHPKDAFEFCFKNGADFIAVGMFDFQVIEDTIIAKKVLSNDEIKHRSRPWCA